MKFKVVRNERSFEEQYFVLYKKNWFTRWKYVKNDLGLISHWMCEKSAQRYIEQEKIKLGLQ